MHTTYISEAQFSSVSLYDEPFSSQAPFCRKVHQMTPKDLDMFKVKNTKIHVIYTPQGPKCHPLRSKMSWAIFELRPNIRKSAPNDLKWPWHVQGQK